MMELKVTLDKESLERAYYEGAIAALESSIGTFQYLKEQGMDEMTPEFAVSFLNEAMDAFKSLNGGGDGQPMENTKNATQKENSYN